MAPASGEARSRAWKPRVALAAAIAVPLLAVFSVLRIAAVGARPGSDVTTTASSVATVVTDLPLPKTASAEAAAAYQAALQAVRDASIVQAAREFRRAASIDPTMAAALAPRAALYGDLAARRSRLAGRCGLCTVPPELAHRERPSGSSPPSSFRSTLPPRPDADRCYAARVKELNARARPGPTRSYSFCLRSSSWDRSSRATRSTRRADQLLARSTPNAQLRLRLERLLLLIGLGSLGGDEVR